MVNVWVGKEVGPELDVLAEIEAKESGHTTTRIGLAREIFLWAFEVYKRAGSLARLKASHLMNPSGRYSPEVQKRAYQDLEKLFKVAPSPMIEEAVRYLADRADKPWSKSGKQD
jgi:hypothetical protein